MFYFNSSHSSNNSCLAFFVLVIVVSWRKTANLDSSTVRTKLQERREFESYGTNAAVVARTNLITKISVGLVKGVSVRGGSLMPEASSPS